MSSLVRLQRESKNKVEVITLRSDGYYVGILEHAGIRVRELGITSLVTGIAAAIRLASIIRDVKPDIVQGLDVPRGPARRRLGCACPAAGAVPSCYGE